MPNVIEIPGMKFRGRKIYLESQNRNDGLVVEHFVRWVEHYMENIVEDSSSYRLKAKQFLNRGN